MAGKIGFEATENSNKGGPGNKKPPIPEDMKKFISSFAKIFDLRKLHKTARKIVAIELLPESEDWSQKDKAEVVGCTDRNYRIHLTKPQVLRAIRDLAPIIAMKSLPKIVRRMEDDATNSYLEAVDRHRAAIYITKFCHGGISGMPHAKDNDDEDGRQEVGASSVHIITQGSDDADVDESLKQYATFASRRASQSD